MWFKEEQCHTRFLSRRQHWHKPEQAFLTDDHRTILRFAVKALITSKGAVLVTLVEIRGGAARPLGAQMVVREGCAITAVLSLAAAWRPLPLKRWR